MQFTSGPKIPSASPLWMQPQAVTLLMLPTIALVAAVYQSSPWLAVAFVFFGLLLVAAQHHRAFFVLAAFALFPFQQSLSGENLSGNFSASDLLLIAAMLSLPLLALRRRVLVIGPPGVPLVLFLGLSAISSLLHWEGLNTGVSLARMWVATLLAVMLLANGNTRLEFAHRCFHLYLIGINVLSVCSMMKFLRGGIRASMYTLTINKNALGPTYGCAIIIALVYLFVGQASGRRRTWLLATVAGASIGSLLSLSRGGWIATAVALMLLLLIRRQLKTVVICVLVLTPLLWGVWNALPDKEKDYATDISSNAHTIQSRLNGINVVMEAYEANPLIGVGVGLRKRVEPHNVIVLTLGEEGILGLCCFIGMFVVGFYTFAAAWAHAKDHSEARQLVMIGACLLLLSLISGMMDVYWRRGVGFLGWASVGMAVNIIHLGRQGKLLHAAPAEKEASSAGRPDAP